MLDLRILDFNYKFLRDLELKRKIKCSSIKVLATKRIDPRQTRGLGGSYSKTFSSVSNIQSTYPIISTNLKNCEYGDSNVIENIYIENLSLPFPNLFKIYNISGNVSIVEDFQLNRYNDSFYKSEIERFKSLILEVFRDYLKSYLSFKKYIDDCYVDDCYVDTNYNCPDNEESYKSNIIYPDLSIDAGTNLVYNRSTGPNYNTTGATYVYFDGAQISWNISWQMGTYDGDASIIDPTVIDPVIFEQNPPVGSEISFYLLTLTVTYPWGPVLTDSKEVVIVGSTP